MSFDIALTSNLKSKDSLLWRRSFVFVFPGNERLWIQLGLGKIRFAHRRPPEKSPKRMGGPDDLMSQSCSVQSPLSSTLRTALR